jgi:hypothetical protein
MPLTAVESGRRQQTSNLSAVFLRDAVSNENGEVASDWSPAGFGKYLATTQDQ